MVRRETIAGGRNRRVFVSLFRGNSKLLPEVENLLETHVVPPRWDPAEESNKVKFTVYFSDDHHLAQTNLKPPLSSLSGVGGRPAPLFTFRSNEGDTIPAFALTDICSCYF